MPLTVDRNKSESTATSTLTATINDFKLVRNQFNFLQLIAFRLECQSVMTNSFDPNFKEYDVNNVIFELISRL